jgi:hypothetical protein
VELVKVVELEELVGSLKNFKSSKNLWNLVHKTSNESLTLQVSVFFLFFFLTFRTKTMNYILLS